MTENAITPREPAQNGRSAHGDESAPARAESRVEPRGDSHDNVHSVHGSLVRPTLTLGVERHVAALEFTLCLTLLLGVGVRLPTICLVAVVVLLIHPTLVWLTARDPLATQVYVRSRGYADYYAPHVSVHASARAALDARVPRPRPSLPRAR